MDEKDLREDNYLRVSLQSGQGRAIIKKITINDIVRIKSGDYGSYNYAPVPITKDLLNENCGAINESIKLKANCELFIGVKEEGHNYANDGKAVLYVHGTPIYTMDCEYLHELQNIFRYLSGKELEINL